MQIPGYPEELEQWWIEYYRHTGGDLQQHEAKLQKQLQQLGELFLSGKTEADYWEDPEMLLAYGLFYFPQTFVRAQFPLIEVMQRGWRSSTNGKIAVLDVGSGPGAAGLSAALVFDGNVELQFVDRSPFALATLQKILPVLPATWRPANAKLMHSNVLTHSALTGGPWDLILMSFSLNELSLADPFPWVKQLLDQLTSEGMLLILEPAMQHTSERLEKLRDDISSVGECFIWGPCLHSQSCPLLKERRFWCHEARNWNPASSQSYLNRYLYRELHVLKFSYLALSRSKPSQFLSSPNYFRLVSPMVKSKGRFSASGCAADGSVNTYEILNRTWNGPKSKLLSLWQRGNCLHVPEMKKAKENIYRIEHPIEVERLL